MPTFQSLKDNLNTMLWDYTSKEFISKILCDILDVFASHFEQEEKIMAKTKYTEIDQHNHEHSAFYARFTELLYQYETNFNSDMVSDIMKTIEEWINEHQPFDEVLKKHYMSWQEKGMSI